MSATNDMQSLKLRLSRRTLELARMLAAKRSISVERLISEQIERLVSEEEDYEQAKKSATR